MENIITVETTITSEIQKVWDCWTIPEHIQKWNFASDDWECPSATNELQAGGVFHYTMAAKDGSVSFDFNGVYTNVVPQSLIEYTMEGGRKVSVSFTEEENGVRVVETFEMENENPRDMQQAGWQTILDNFKGYVENN